MREDLITNFRNTYADLLTFGMSEFIGLQGRRIVQEFHDSLRKSRTIYLFGNGGCHAISKCFEYALQSYASSQGMFLRVETGVDVHNLALQSPDTSPGMPFVRVLQREGANKTDIVILISGSGNSDNLCDVASYTSGLSIPTLAIIGSSKGAIRDFVQPNSCFCVKPEDQQLSEDIIQSLAYFLGTSVSGQDIDWAKIVSAKMEELKRLIVGIPEVFLATISNLIVESFYSDKSVWVLGFDHPALSVCAEHTAHNLYWDSVYEVEDPPERLIRSSATYCDYSGIANDRRRDVISNFVGSGDNDKNGVAILYSMNSSDPSMRGLLDRFEEQNVPVFLFCAERDDHLEGSGLTIHETRVKEPQIHAGVSQIFGHILGRMTRMSLLEREDPPNDLISDPGAFLANRDLAQRRLLDG